MVKKFNYKLPFDWDSRYRHVIEDHNNLSHSLPSIEDTWMTYWWECRLSGFILAFSEVNAFLILRYWSFVACWCDNLLTIYTLETGRGGLIYCQTPFIG